MEAGLDRMIRYTYRKTYAKIFQQPAVKCVIILSTKGNSRAHNDGRPISEAILRRDDSISVPRQLPAPFGS